MRLHSFFLYFVCSYLALANAWAQGASITPTNKEVSDRLELHLGRIESDAHSKRIVDGVIFLGLGVGFGIGAAVASNSTDSDTRKNGPAVYGIISGLFTAGGILVLVYPTEAETTPQEFRKLPNRSEEEIRARILKGEAELTHLADRAHNTRIWGGGTLIAVGAASTALYASTTDKSKNSFLLYEGVFLTGFGILRLLQKSVAEQQLIEYREWRTPGKPAVLSSLDMGIFPVQSGAGLALTGRF